MLDIFNGNHVLLIKKDMHKNCLGSFFTLILYAVYIMIQYFFLKDYINKENPKQINNILRFNLTITELPFLDEAITFYQSSIKLTNLQIKPCLKPKEEYTKMIKNNELFNKNLNYSYSCIDKKRPASTLSFTLPNSILNETNLIFFGLYYFNQTNNQSEFLFNDITYSKSIILRINKTTFNTGFLYDKFESDIQPFFENDRLLNPFTNSRFTQIYLHNTLKLNYHNIYYWEKIYVSISKAVTLILIFHYILYKFNKLYSEYSYLHYVSNFINHEDSEYLSNNLTFLRYISYLLNVADSKIIESIDFIKRNLSLENIYSKNNLEFIEQTKTNDENMLIKTIKKIDYMSHEFILEDESKTYNIYGGIFTIIWFVSFIILIILFGIDFINKKNTIFIKSVININDFIKSNSLFLENLEPDVLIESFEELKIEDDLSGSELNSCTDERIKIFDSDLKKDISKFYYCFNTFNFLKNVHFLNILTKNSNLLLHENQMNTTIYYKNVTEKQFDIEKESDSIEEMKNYTIRKIVTQQNEFVTLFLVNSVCLQSNSNYFFDSLEKIGFNNYLSVVKQSINRNLKLQVHTNGQKKFIYTFEEIMEKIPIFLNNIYSISLIFSFFIHFFFKLFSKKLYINKIKKYILEEKVIKEKSLEYICTDDQILCEHVSIERLLKYINFKNNYKEETDKANGIVKTSYFNKFDLISNSNPEIFIDGHKTTKTILGGSISFIFAIFVVVISLLLGDSILFHKNPLIVGKYIYGVNKELYSDDIDPNFLIKLYFPLYYVNNTNWLIRDNNKNIQLNSTIIGCSEEQLSKSKIHRPDNYVTICITNNMQQNYFMVIYCNIKYDPVFCKNTQNNPNQNYSEIFIESFYYELDELDYNVKEKYNFEILNNTRSYEFLFTKSEVIKNTNWIRDIHSKKSYFYQKKRNSAKTTLSNLEIDILFENYLNNNKNEKITYFQLIVEYKKLIPTLLGIISINALINSILDFVVYFFHYYFVFASIISNYNKYFDEKQIIHIDSNDKITFTTEIISESANGIQNNNNLENQIYYFTKEEIVNNFTLSNYIFNFKLRLITDEKIKKMFKILISKIDFFNLLDLINTSGIDKPFKNLICNNANESIQNLASSLKVIPFEVTKINNKIDN